MASLVQSKNHLAYLDSIRAICAVYVVMHHAVEYYSLETLTGLKKISLAIFAYGHLAVDIFIVLSGFSLMLSVIKSDYSIKGGVLIFLKRRAIRILPPYYFSILFSLLLIKFFIGSSSGDRWDLSIPVKLQDIFTHIFLIHDFLSGSIFKINYALWSISVEFRIYLFFPILIWFLIKTNFITTLSAAIVISVIGTFILIYLGRYNQDILVKSAGVSPYIVLFSLGMLAAELSFSKAKSSFLLREFYSKHTLISIVIFVAVYFVIAINIIHQFRPNGIFENGFGILDQVIDIFVGIFAILLLFVCSVTSSNKLLNYVLRILSWRPLSFLGTFSFSIYLIHAPLLQMIRKYILSYFEFDDLINCYLLLSFGTALIVLCSYLFFLICERPFLVLGKPVDNKS